MKRLSYFMASLFCVMIISGVAQATDPQCEQIYEEAMRSYAGADAEQALVLAWKALKASGKNTGSDSVCCMRATMLIADIYTSYAMYPEAMALYRKVFGQQQRIYGERSPSTGKILRVLASDDVTPEKIAQARQMLSAELATGGMSVRSSDPLASDFLKQCVMALMNQELPTRTSDLAMVGMP